MFTAGPREMDPEQLVAQLAELRTQNQQLHQALQQVQQQQSKNVFRLRPEGQAPNQLSPSRLWPKLVFESFGHRSLRGGGAGVPLEPASPKGGGSEGVGPRRGGEPQISRFFCLSRSHFRSFSSLSGVFSWNFGDV